MGMLWGLSLSLCRIAIVNDGTVLGVAFWQTLLSSFYLIVFTALRRRYFMPRRHHIVPYVIIGMIGVVLPDVSYYLAASRVPVGVLAITVALVPIFTYCFTLALRFEVFSLIRVVGVICGTVAILMLVGPQNSLPDRTVTLWVLLACFSSFCYASENIYLTLRKIIDIGPIRLSCGMNLTAAIILAPLMFVFDQVLWPNLPFGILEWSVLSLSLVTTTAYVIYITTVQTCGPLFASQVGYLVTIFGVFWGMAIFDETHSPWVWASLALMILGMALVSPRHQRVGT